VITHIRKDNRKKWFMKKDLSGNYFRLRSFLVIRRLPIRREVRCLYNVDRNRNKIIFRIEYEEKTYNIYVFLYNLNTIYRGGHRVRIVSKARKPLKIKGLRAFFVKMLAY